MALSLALVETPRTKKRGVRWNVPRYLAAMAISFGAAGEHVSYEAGDLTAAVRLAALDVEIARAQETAR